MKVLIPLISFILLLGCSASDTSNNQTESTGTSSKKDSAINVSSEKLDAERLSNKNPKMINKSNFSARSALDKLEKSDDTRKLVYLLHPTEEIIVYCYQKLRSECYISGQYNGIYFEYDLTGVESRNIGQITINEVESAQTIPTEWMDLTEEKIQIKMETQIVMDSKRYISYEPLIIFFDDRGVFWR